MLLCTHFRKLTVFLKRISSLLKSGLGTVFFSVRYIPFFSVPFPSFWQLMRPKRMFHSFPFFSKEWKRRQRTQRTQSSFAKNVKECENVSFFCNIYIDIYRYVKDCLFTWIKTLPWAKIDPAIYGLREKRLDLLPREVRYFSWIRHGYLP